MAKSYHEYFIKDGMFVGNFEKMYQEFEDPWHQTTDTPVSKASHIAALNINKFNIRSVIEVGCGLGHFTHLIHDRTKAKVLGIDISSTAIAKARQNFPNVCFEVAGVRDLRKYRDHDAILFAEVTWYILDNLDRAFDEMLRYFNGKFFLHNLVFYKGSTQKYGREYFTNFEEFTERCPFKLLEWTISTDVNPDSVIETSSVFKIERK